MENSSIDLEFKVMEANIIRKELQDILNSMNSGLVSVDQNLCIGDYYSQLAVNFLGKDPLKGLLFPELIYPNNEPFRQQLSQVLELAFQKKATINLLKSLLPEKKVRLRPGINNNEIDFIWVDLNFNLIKNSEGKVVAIIVSMNNVTGEVNAQDELEKKNLENDENLALVTIFADQGLDIFNNFVLDQLDRLKQAQKILDSPEIQSETEIQELKRIFHTLKGEAANLNMPVVEQKAHQLEDLLLFSSNDNDPKQRLKLAELIDFLKGEIRRIDQKVLEMTGGDRVGATETGLSVNIPLSLLDQLEEVLRAPDTQPPQKLGDLKNELKKYQQTVMQKLFNRISKTADRLSKKLGKKMYALYAVGGKVKVDMKILNPLQEILIHLLRNALDHGIESPLERKRAGKDEKGIIYLETLEKDRNLQIIFRDDGQGIDLEKLKDKAISKNLTDAARWKKLSMEEKQRFIFYSGLSTKNQLEITTISGRGIGMDVVDKNVKQLGGSILVNSQKNKGTEFKILLPLNPN